MSSGASFVEEINGDYTLKTTVSNALVTIDTGLPGTTLITGNLSVVGSVTFSGNASTISDAIANGTSRVSILATNGNVDITIDNNGIASFNPAGLNVDGNITGNYILGNGAFLTGMPVQYSNANVTAFLPTYTGNLVSLQGDVTTLGNITGNYILGNGALLTGLPVQYSNANVADFISTYTGNISSGNLVIVGDGNISGANVVSASTVNVSTVSAAGNITANYFVGNGSQLIGVVPTEVGTLANLTVSGNIVSGNISVVDALSAGSIQVVGGNIIGANNIVATGNVTGGNLLTSGVVSSSANIVGANIVGGNIYGDNLSLTGSATIDGRILGSNVRIGTDSGLTNQSAGAIAIGLNAGYENQGQYAIAIGSGAGATNQGNNSIVLNASGTTLNGTNANAFYVNPVRNNLANIGNVAFYDPSSKEITYANALSLTGNITGATGQFNNGLFVSGNITATGNINYQNVTELVIGDPLIYLGANNTADLWDLGFVGSFLEGTYQHTGLVRDHTDNTWKLFTGVTAEPTTTIDWANATYAPFLAGSVTSVGNIISAGNVTANAFFGDGGYLSNISAGNIGAPGSNTQIIFNNAGSFGANAGLTFNFATQQLGVNAITTTNNSNLTLIPNGTGIVVVTDTVGGATGIQMGTPTAGSLVSNAVTLTTSTSVTNGIAQLNTILGKLVPPAPPNFPNATTLSITTATTAARMASGFTQPDNTPGANKAVAAGTLVNVTRVPTYATNTITNVGPGDSGKLTVYLNGVDAGNVTFNNSASPSANGYHGNLYITNNYDYHIANSSIAAGFWYVFSSSANGVSVPSGWNEVYLSDNVTGNTNTPNWYYDNSTVAAPQFTSVTFAACASPTYSYTSTIPHYTSATNFNIGFQVNRLSGNTYPNNGNLLTNSTAASGAFAAPASISYAAANVTVPLAQNLYVSSGAATANTTSAIISGFGASNSGPTVTVTNGYNSSTNTFSPGATVLYKTGNSVAIDEGNIVIGSVIGSGSGNAYRIVNPGAGNTPVYTGSEAAFNSQTSTLQTYDATVVGSGTAGVLKHDQTNYSTGYLPVGPDLSSGRSGTQYFTFKFVRTAVSKFDIKYTGNIAGMWVALPGSVIDSSSGANGWIDMSVAYGGAGYPGVNAPGNGSDGCAVGGTVALNTSVTNSSKTCTFGTVSSSSTATNEIYVRIALTSGQSVTALTLQTASN